MADEQLDLDASIDDFFQRSGLTSQDRLECYSFIEKLYPGRAISPASCQGYCSMTIFVGEDTVVQFRPHSYRLDLRIADAARQVYGTFAPETKYLTTLSTSGLVVCSMQRIEGISLKHFRASGLWMARSTPHRMELCKDFAAFLAKSWHKSNIQELPLGQVGQSIVARLKSLSTNLPFRYQPAVRNVLRNLHRIEALPWVLTHGDIVAANIMVQPSTGRLTGLVDWAEAERLPFGICLYGLEEVLGEMTGTGFQYYERADELRNLFWTELQRHVPDLEQELVLDTVKLARDLGVLLWYGIAFDNGAIDRVVQEGRDVEEIQRLDVFLDVYEYNGMDRSSKI
jgi:aminoglycoside phosphotransferase